MLAAAVSGGQIYISTDAGVSWTAREAARQWQAIASSSDGSRLAAVAVENNFDSPGQIYTSVGSAPEIGFTAAATAGSTSFTFQVRDDAASNNLDLSPNTITINVAPTLTNNTVNLASDAVTLTINGTGFDTTPGNNTVALSGGATGSVTAATNTSLTVTNLSGLTAGALNAVVTTNSQSSGAAVQVATVLNSVSDTTPPVITRNGSASVSVSWGSSYIDAGAFATDNVDPSVTVITSGTVNTAKPGTYTVTYTATDVALNAATPVTRTVTVSIPAATTVGPDGFSPLMKYAFGANASGDTVQAPATSSTATTLSITAVVRTNDPAVVVTGEADDDLTGTWGTGGAVTVTLAADQTNLPPNCVRRVFTVSTTGAPRRFIRLKVVGTF
jgi:hypothetical protein